VVFRSRLVILQSIFPQEHILVQSDVKMSEKPHGAGGAEALGVGIDELEVVELLDVVEEQMSGTNGQTPALMQFGAHSVALRSRFVIVQSMLPHMHILVHSGVRSSEKPQGAGGAEADGIETDELEVVELIEVVELMLEEVLRLDELLLDELELELELDEGH
jgi:hypothetical protein